MEIFDIFLTTIIVIAAVVYIVKHIVTDNGCSSCSACNSCNNCLDKKGNTQISEFTEIR